MGLFDNMLRSGETLFRDETALDFDYVPKLLPFRDQQQSYIASAIKPLFQERPGRNLCITGPPGIGKTAAVKWVLRELEETTDDIKIIYLNCWQKNTTFKVLVEICHELGFVFTVNKKVNDLMSVLEGLFPRKNIVLAFDEIDKAEDHDFLYFILENCPHKSIILITNFRNWLSEVDTRIRSRLTPDMIEFGPYKEEEVHQILKQRIGYAFVPGSFGNEALMPIAKRTFENRDLRSGLYLLREAGLVAEARSMRMVTSEHATTALAKLADFSIKDAADLDEDCRKILETIKAHPDDKIGDLFKKYQDSGGVASYKTFTRKIDKLEQNSFIVVEKVNMGNQGNTSIVRPVGERRLTDYT